MILIVFPSVKMTHWWKKWLLCRERWQLILRSREASIGRAEWTRKQWQGESYKKECAVHNAASVHYLSIHGALSPSCQLSAASCTPANHLFRLLSSPVWWRWAKLCDIRRCPPGVAGEISSGSKWHGDALRTSISSAFYNKAGVKLVALSLPTVLLFGPLGQTHS